jgi:pectin methylesterase-like acyl-CoA thioesterase
MKTHENRYGSGCRRGLLAGAVAICALGLCVPRGAEAAVAKRKFDFVVGVDGDWKAAVAAAAQKASSSYRFYILFPDGEYNVGALTGDANQKTNFTTSNVSFIGQSADKSILYNKSVNEGIGITATLYLNKAHNLYMQDLTVMNRANYGQPSTYGATGRHVAIQEQADKMIYKNVKQLSTQDTYYTKGSRTYWEGGQIDGTTDFICGAGDVFFNGVTLNELKDGSPITAGSPNTSNAWGYVFKNCTINATKDGYQLGRSWGEARVVFLNTKMNKIPSAAGWGDPMNNVPKVFAEYKSVNASGAAVDLSKRRTTYTKDGTTVTLKPVLTDAEAAKYTIPNVLSGTDNWKPDDLARQVSAPVVRQEGTLLKWNDNDSALCWAIFKGGKYLANVATNSYDVSKLAKGDILTVRAANSMGGLGANSNAVTVGTPTGVAPQAHRSLHDIAQVGNSLRIASLSAPARLRIVGADGALVRSISLDPSTASQSIDLASQNLKAGMYFARLDGAGVLSLTTPVFVAR